VLLGHRLAHPAFAGGRVGPIDLPKSGERWPLLEIVLTEGCALEGRVTDEAGDPVAGARITARRADPGVARGRMNRAPQAVRAASSAKDGTFKLDRLDAGPSEVTVAALGYATETVSGFPIGPEGVRRDFRLVRGRSITGRVVDTEGSPLAGAEVTALLDPPAARDGSQFRKHLEQRVRSGLALARSGEDGRYELRDLPAGVYAVVARASGFEAAQVEDVEAGGAAPDLVLARFSAVRGAVREARSGRAISAFTVNAIDRVRRGAEGGELDWRVGSQGELAFHDPLGKFIYDGLPPGEYEVIVLAPGFRSFHVDLKLRAGEELEIDARLERGARIEGRVVEEGTDLPLYRAHVSVCLQVPREEWKPRAGAAPGPVPAHALRPPMPPPSGMGDVLTGDDGSFAVEGLLEGKYSVSARHPLHEGPPVMIQLGPLETARLEIRLPATGRLEGHIAGVRKGEGRRHLTQSLEFQRLGPPGGAGEKSRDEWGVQVDPSGSFQAQGLRPGRYRLVLRQQEIRLGRLTETGPGSGHRDLETAGPESTAVLGEVEVEPGRTTYFHGKAE